MAVFRQLFTQLQTILVRQRTGCRTGLIRLQSSPKALSTVKPTYWDARKCFAEKGSRKIDGLQFRQGIRLMHVHTAPQQQDSTVVPLQTYVQHNDQKALEITWKNAETQKYAYPWLRDNCRCESCYSLPIHSRIVSMLELDVEAVPEDVKISAGGGRLTLTWPDKHVSEYCSSWLRENRFDRSVNDPVLYPTLRYWGSEIDESVSILKLDDILRSNEALYKLLKELKTSGLCCVKGGGSEEGNVKKIADRIAFLHLTYFGATDHVRMSYDSTHVAYTSRYFPMHTDLAYKGRPPGVQMIHCIQQARDEGGENWFTDGFKVALDLKKADPEAYDTLCNVPMEFKDIGTYTIGRVYQRSCHPVIGLDMRGNPNHIYLGDHGREPMLRIPAEEVLPVYRALKKFSDIYHQPKNVYHYKLQEGDIMVFDNRRVIHGRAAFKVTQRSNRDLETGYLEWDEIDSRLRILMEDLSTKSQVDQVDGS